MEAGTGAFKPLGPCRTGASIHHQGVNISQGAKPGERRPSQFGSVGDHHHLIGGTHHGPFGFHKQQVAVEQPLLGDAADTQDRDPDMQSSIMRMVSGPMATPVRG